MPSIDDSKVGAALPERRHTPTNVLLFLYNAAISNPNRVRYGAQVEKHPAVVVGGPLKGDRATQVLKWPGDNSEPLEFEYSKRRAFYFDERMISRTVKPDEKAETSAFVKTEADEITTSGRIVVINLPERIDANREDCYAAPSRSGSGAGLRRNHRWCRPVRPVSATPPARRARDERQAV